MSSDNKKGYPFIIILVAVLLLIGLSFVPWSRITGGYFKNFDLFSDVTGKTDTTVVVAEIIDPELLKVINETEQQPTDSVTPLAKSTPAVALGSLAETDTLAQRDTILIAKQPSRVDGKVVIEDYTPDQSGLKHLKAALTRRNSRPARIAVLGDSYIEGDILTQDLRALLQKHYGGNGVGYMPAHSEVAGFRVSVGHSFSGWDYYDIGRASKSKYFLLAGRFHIGSAGATINYKGVKRPNLEGWNTSSMLFIAPQGGSITLTTDDGSETFAVEASKDVQQITLPGQTSSLKVKSMAPGLVMLGAWLNDSTGITVDNMSVRGDSGITRSRLNKELCRQMGQYVDYDLIVLEFGINALTAAQKNYSHYGKLMGEVIEQVRQCYPNADILLLGIGDRGQKANGEVRSMPTVGNMIDAQREVARQHGVLFWDTREAMGGEGAIVDWRERKLVNADYIHLNAKGGNVLGTSLFNSINRKLHED